MFDYIKAWKETVLPQFMKITNEEREIFGEVKQWETKLTQNKETLDVEHVEDPPNPNLVPLDFQKLFAGLTTERLSDLAWFIYYFGHLAPTYGYKVGTEEENAALRVAVDAQKNGLYWKFSNLADQELSRRVGHTRLPTKHRYPLGFSVRISQGTMVLVETTSDSLSNHEIGRPSKELYEILTQENALLDIEALKAAHMPAFRDFSRFNDKSKEKA